MSRLIPLLFLLLFSTTAAAGDIPPASDLAATADEAHTDGKTVVIFFYQEECQYCETVREQFLRPILNNDDYIRRITLRQVNTRSEASLRDFRGEATTHSRFAARRDKKLTPTIAIYGPDGSRLVEPLVGLKGGTAYYGHNLDEAIEQAEQKLAQK
ncbi:thioredoxin family protein [Thiohalorhabdus methylotrophus]|uniref:Thioredoxin family protein n=1 Tax=Thiohalorhabdus methylotrophus TaxID=3242694 RepID=A0ABV4TT40_9GAMM